MKRLQWFVASGAVLLAALLFIIRGPLGAYHSSYDFAVIYASVLGWSEGVNPYDAQQLTPLWEQAGGPNAGMAPASRGSRDLLYPPTTHALLWPISLLDWNTAQLAWLAFNVALVGVLIWSLITMAGISKRSQASLWIVAAVLAFAPIHTSLKVGQTAVLAASMLAGAYAMQRSKRTGVAGIMLALGAAAKPQLVLPFIAYEFIRKRFRVGLVAVLGLAAIAAVGIGRLELAGIDWTASLRSNLAAFTAEPPTLADANHASPAADQWEGGAWIDNGGGAGSIDHRNPHRHQMINLAPLVATFIHDTSTAQLVTWAIIAAIVLVGFIVWLRHAEDERELIALSIGCALSLLLVYHRFYDAAVLLIPLTWCVVQLRQRLLAAPIGQAWLTHTPLHVWVAIACIGVFFAPGAAILKVLETQGRIPASLTDTLFYTGVIELHQIWALLVLTAALMAALARCPRHPPRPPRPPHPPQPQPAR